jgi:hypothetical protein
MNRLTQFGVEVGAPALISSGFFIAANSFEFGVENSGSDILETIVPVAFYGLGSLFAIQAINHTVMFIQDIRRSNEVNQTEV